MLFVSPLFSKHFKAFNRSPAFAQQIRRAVGAQESAQGRGSRTPNKGLGFDVHQQAHHSVPRVARVQFWWGVKMHREARLTIRAGLRYFLSKGSLITERAWVKHNWLLSVMLPKDDVWYGHRP